MHLPPSVWFVQIFVILMVSLGNDNGYDIV
jgi:hypothetical protein